MAMIGTVFRILAMNGHERRRGLKEILLMILATIIATAIFVKGIEIFVQFNLWLGGLMGMGYK